MDKIDELRAQLYEEEFKEKVRSWLYDRDKFDLRQLPRDSEFILELCQRYNELTGGLV